MNKLVLGVFIDRMDAEEAISKLEGAGYNPKDMSIVMKDSEVVNDDTGSSVAGGAVSGIVAGGILGALSGLGLSGEEAKEYEESIKAGGILVIVPAKAGEDDEVRAIMQEYNAGQVRSISNSEAGEFSRSRRTGDDFTRTHSYK